MALGGEPDGKGPAHHAAADGPGRVEATIRVGDGPTALATRSGTTWVAARDSGEVQAISLKDAKVDKARTIDLGESGQPISVAVGFDSVWIVDDTRNVLIRAPLDAPENRVTIPRPIPRTWPFRQGACGSLRRTPTRWFRSTGRPTQSRQLCRWRTGPLSVSYGDGGVWVACIEAGSVLPIDAKTAEQGKPIEAGTRPNQATVGNKAIWVIDNLEGVVRRIDPEDLVQDIQVGARPRGVVADSGSIWVTNAADGRMIRTTSLGAASPSRSERSRQTSLPAGGRSGPRTSMTTPSAVSNPSRRAKGDERNPRVATERALIGFSQDELQEGCRRVGGTGRACRGAGVGRAGRRGCGREQHG